MVTRCTASASEMFALMLKSIAAFSSSMDWMRSRVVRSAVACSACCVSKKARMACSSARRWAWRASASSLACAICER